MTKQNKGFMFTVMDYLGFMEAVYHTEQEWMAVKGFF